MGPTLLIIDDSRLARMMIRTFALKALPDISVLEAESGDQAVALIETLNDLAFCTIDHNMPGPRGIELAGRIKARFPDAVLALVTANVQEPLQRRAADAGLHFIGKPLTEQKVLAFFSDGATVT